MKTLNELDTVVLTRDLPEHDLKQGDVGAIVHVYGEAAAYEVEFVSGAGNTVAVLTLEPDVLRLMRRSEVLHAREYAA